MIALKKYRLKALMTQNELAKKLGVSSSAVTMWETGARKPNIIMLKRLSKLLNCTTDDLLKDISTKN